MMSSTMRINVVIPGISWTILNSDVENDLQLVIESVLLENIDVTAAYSLSCF